MNEYSGVLIPIVAMLIPIVAIVGGIYNQAQTRRLKADQRMAMIARGVPPAEIEAYFRAQPSDEAQANGRDPMRSLGNARRTAVVLISLGLGLTAFFLIFGAVMLTHVNPQAGWALIAVSAAGLIPLGIGVGFAVDYRLQTKEMKQFGLEV